MTVALYPGRFDPVTLGHLDIVKRAAAIFDRVIVSVAESRSTLFTTAERVELFRNAVQDLPTVSVVSHSNLTVQVAHDMGAQALVRGLRAITDFTNEFDMALMNRNMAPEIESVFLMTALEHTFISASRVRELSSFGRDVTDLVPPGVAEALRLKQAAR